MPSPWVLLVQRLRSAPNQTDTQPNSLSVRRWSRRASNGRPVSWTAAGQCERRADGSIPWVRYPVPIRDTRAAGAERYHWLQAARFGVETALAAYAGETVTVFGEPDPVAAGCTVDWQEVSTAGNSANAW